MDVRELHNMFYLCTTMTAQLPILLFVFGKEKSTQETPLIQKKATLVGPHLVIDPLLSLNYTCKLLKLLRGIFIEEMCNYRIPLRAKKQGICHRK